MVRTLSGGRGALKSRGGGSGPGGDREEVGAKGRAGRREIAAGRGLGGMGAEGSRGMGAGDGCWRWRGSRALGLIVRGLRARERSPELEKGLGVQAEALMGAVLRGLAGGIWKSMGGQGQMNEGGLEVSRERPVVEAVDVGLWVGLGTREQV